MKSTKILKELVKNVENAGVCEKQPESSNLEFISFWFNALTFCGNIKQSATYLYVYEEPLKGVADAVIDTGECKVYLYEIED